LLERGRFPGVRGKDWKSSRFLTGYLREEGEVNHITELRKKA